MTTVTGLDNALSVLEAVASEKTQQRILEAAGDSFVEDTVQYIEDGNSFVSRTGRLIDSIGWTMNKSGSVIITAQAMSQPKRLYQNGPLVGKSVNYAPFIEFGTKKHRAYPFMYVDLDVRRENVTDAVLSVLATVANGG